MTDLHNFISVYLEFLFSFISTFHKFLFSTKSQLTNHEWVCTDRLTNRQQLLLQIFIRQPKKHVSYLNSRLLPDCLRLTVFVSSIHLRAVYCATLLGLDDWRVTWPCCFVVCRGVLLRSRINSNPTNIGSFSAYPRPQLYHISYVNALFSEGAEISCLAMFDFISIPFISIFSLISNLSRLKRTLFSCKWDSFLASKLWLRWCCIDQNMYPIQHHPKWIVSATYLIMIRWKITTRLLINSLLLTQLVLLTTLWDRGHLLCIPWWWNWRCRCGKSWCSWCCVQVCSGHNRKRVSYYLGNDVFRNVCFCDCWFE